MPLVVCWPGSYGGRSKAEKLATLSGAEIKDEHGTLEFHSRLEVQESLRE